MPAGCKIHIELSISFTSLRDEDCEQLRLLEFIQKHLEAVYSVVWETNLFHDPFCQVIDVELTVEFNVFSLAAGKSEQLMKQTYNIILKSGVVAMLPILASTIGENAKLTIAT